MIHQPTNATESLNLICERWKSATQPFGIWGATDLECVSQFRGMILQSVMNPDAGFRNIEWKLSGGGRAECVGIRRKISMTMNQEARDLFAISQIALSRFGAEYSDIIEDWSFPWWGGSAVKW